jgi:formate hydrogenlyase transcriptional activator
LVIYQNYADRALTLFEDIATMYIVAPKKTVSGNQKEYSKVPLEDGRVLLGFAAVFEGEFSVDWLEELTSLKATVILISLEEAAERQILAKISPGIYAFKDTQEQLKCVNKLSPKEKEQCHQGVAAIFIRELSDDDSKALRIAEHLLHLTNSWKTCEWLLKAGDVFSKSLPTEKAIACFRKVLNDLSDQKGTNEDRLFIKAAMGNSINSIARHNVATDLALLREAKERAKRLNNMSDEILLDMHIAKYERFVSGFNVALESYEQAFAKAKRLGDSKLMASTTMFSTYFLFWQGRFREVVEIYEKSLPDVERRPIGQFPLMVAMMVGCSYAMTGQFAQGLGMANAVRDFCLQKRDFYLSAHAEVNIAIVMLSVNRFDDAIRYSKISLKNAETSGNYTVKLIGTLILSLSYCMKGVYEESLRYLRQFLKNRREGSAGVLLMYPYLMEICWAIETGVLPGLPGLSFEREMEQMLAAKNVYTNGVAYRYQALFGKSTGWTNQKVVQSLTVSAKLLAKSGCRIELFKTQLEFVRYFVSMGDHKKGKTTMRTALDTLPPGHADLIPDDLRNMVSSQDSQGTAPHEILDLTTQMVARQDNIRFFQQIVATANRITGAERGAILLLGEDQNLEVRASKNLTKEHIRHPNFASSKKIIEEVASSGKGRIFEIEQPDDNSLASGEVVRSGICVPVSFDGQVIGVLYHDNRLISNAFKQSDLAYLAYCAALCAVDLDRKKAHQEIRLLHEKYEERRIDRESNSIEVREVEGIVGVSAVLQHVMSQIAQIAKSDSAILILGETGVGKNLVAREIHRQSHRKDGPFITVQCSALTESLITSELFGHEKGAFTGATHREIGRFELADKGTLFLDEIGDLSLEVQARLLRVLQSKEFERVGGGKDTLISNFRLITATNRNLEEEVKAKRFREDLYYRIDVFPLHIPPLRERKEDIPLLANYFVRLYADKQGDSPSVIPREMLEKLVHYDWPGNIRELENVIQRSIVSTSGDRFCLPALKINQRNAAQTTDFCTLREMERRHILEALSIARWKIHGSDGAAKILDINPFTLASRMKKLGINRPTKDKTIDSQWMPQNND